MDPDELTLHWHLHSLIVLFLDTVATAATAGHTWDWASEDGEPRVLWYISWEGLPHYFCSMFNWILFLNVMSQHLPLLSGGHLLTIPKALWSEFGSASIWSVHLCFTSNTIKVKKQNKTKTNPVCIAQRSKIQSGYNIRLTLQGLCTKHTEDKTITI